jgi:hypothetical protein
MRATPALWDAAEKDWRRGVFTGALPLLGRGSRAHPPDCIEVMLGNRASLRKRSHAIVGKRKRARTNRQSPSGLDHRSMPLHEGGRRLWNDAGYHRRTANQRRGSSRHVRAQSSAASRDGASASHTPVRDRQTTIRAAMAQRVARRASRYEFGSALHQHAPVRRNSTTNSLRMHVSAARWCRCVPHDGPASPDLLRQRSFLTNAGPRRFGDGRL